MATIEQLLGATTDEIEKMSDTELKLYLADICKLEPKMLPVPLGAKIKVVVLEDEGEDADIPIKLRKVKDKKKPNVSIDSLKSLFE